MILLLLSFMSQSSIDFQISDSFYPLLGNQYRYLILVGGKGSGKSEFAARKMLYRCWVEGNHKFIALRKVRRTVYDSLMEVWKIMLNENKINFDCKESTRVISFKNSKGQPNEIHFEGLDDPEKIESIKGITGGHIEELTEFSENEFTILDLCLREQLSIYEQIIMSFNPELARAQWIKDVFFPKEKIATGEGKIYNSEKSYIHHSTVLDNPIRKIREAYQKRLDGIKDVTARKIYRDGQWALPKGLIYPNWDICDLPNEDENWYDAVWHGGDFGFSVDPTAVVKIYRKADHYWLEEIIYELDLTNRDIANKLKKKNIGEREIFFDSSEPKSIKELRLLGINAKPALKGPDSVEAGIKYLQELNIHIVRGSQNLEKEQRGYKFEEDRSGTIKRKPIDFNNHLMDASRYGIFTKANKHIQVFV